LIPPSDETSGVTWEQHEIELALAPNDEAADALVLAQYVLANVAKQLHIAVSFALMLLPGHAGSGLHQHVSVVCDDIHLPHVTDDGIMSDLTSWLVGGLLELGRALMCVGNRVEDSFLHFLRLTQGKEAPKGIFWGYYNRGSMIRLPVQVIRRERGSSEVPVTPATVEYRLGDGSAFPHLLLAGIAHAATYATTIPRDTLRDRVVAGASSCRTSVIMTL
jgi:glutamine synthetase